MSYIRVPFDSIYKLFPNSIIYEAVPFKIYYSGREGDEWGYLVTFLDEKTRYISHSSIVRTSHGNVYMASKEEMQEYILELEAAIASTEMFMRQAGMMDYGDEKNES